MTTEVTSQRLFIPMAHPQAKQRARTVTTKAGLHMSYTPAETRNAEKYIRDSWIAAFGPKPRWERNVALYLLICVYLVRPPSIPKRRLFPTVKPDSDNFLKLVQDSLNGFAWYDDAQITHPDIKKRYVRPECGDDSGGVPGVLLYLCEDEL